GAAGPASGIAGRAEHLAQEQPLADAKVRRGVEMGVLRINPERNATDGAEGGRARMAAADKYVSGYDIATEYGFGRRDPETIPERLRIHQELCG
ncbi:MAG: hypothetical protein VB959_08110, partial [Rhodospirillales bacterium]